MSDVKGKKKPFIPSPFYDERFGSDDVQEGSCLYRQYKKTPAEIPDSEKTPESDSTVEESSDEE